MPYCAKCGGIVAEGDEFCTNCGARISPAAGNQAYPSPLKSTSPITGAERPRSHRTRNVVLAVALILIIGVAAFVSYSGYLNLAPSKAGSSSASTSSSTSGATSTSPSTTAASIIPTTTTSSSAPASTSATSSTTGSSSTTSTTGASTSSTTCTTYSVGNSQLQFAYMIGNYSSLSLVFIVNSTSNGQSSITNESISYSVVYHSSHEYKVATNIASNGVAGTETFWLGNNGTLVAVEYQGENLTSTAAANEYTSLLELMSVISNPQALLGSFGGYMHLGSTGAVTLGTTQVRVSNYVPNTVPFTNTCAGETYVSFALQVGAPAGVSFGVVTYFSDSWTVPGGTTSGVFRVTALTAA